METLSQAAYAKQRGLSQQAVHAAAKRGQVILTDEGKVDVEATDRKWPAVRIKSRDRDADPDGDGYSLLAEKTRREAAMARLAELDLAQKRGELVSRQAIEREIGAMLIQCRDSLVSFCSRVAPIVAAQTDPAKCRLMLLDGIAEALRAGQGLELTAGEDGRD